ncbi:MAG TPA: crosslink repair DNA glycosylase YcaQ family protein [Anaerolineae bacterium]|nr:crosslink repair DNA glycosylase YcaQ family protein [Anaerolineae bacterium]
MSTDGSRVISDLTLDGLLAVRAERYRQRPHLRVRTEDEALGFLNDVGLCLLFSAKDVELPSLWGALCGEDRPLPNHHDSRELGLAWHWKDTLPVAGKVLYGKFLRKKPVFVSLDLAPYLYALSPNYGDLAEDYLEDYQDGRLSVEAKQVYEVLLEHGALPTSRLRREAGLGGKSNASRFDRALAELQMDFRITKVAISDANRWGYCYVYDLLPRHFPEAVTAARAISGRQARETIMLRYLQTVLAATSGEIGKLFGWLPTDVDRVADRLAAEGRLHRGVHIEGLAGEYLVSAA